VMSWTRFLLGPCGRFIRRSAAPKPPPLRNLMDAGRGADVACHVGWLEAAGRMLGHDRAPVVSEGKAQRTSLTLIRSGIS
jgi:hypothetical protein